MLQSMTGFGRAEGSVGERRLIVELRSVNSKQADVSLRIATELKDKEIEIRQWLASALERGKIDMRLDFADGHLSSSLANRVTLNKEAFLRHYNELVSLHQETGLALPENMTDTILRFKDVTEEVEAEPLSDNDWLLAKEIIGLAINDFKHFREQEGAALQQMFTQKLDAISLLLEQVEQYESSRVENIRQHLLQNLDKLASETRKAIDMNRLEEEMIYYLEKLDITEEKVRLRNHISYFRQTMAADGVGVGKKLGFVAQEMGREINTLGSKSNQSEMQIIVVKMKDLLEQIKEQVLNVL